MATLDEIAPSLELEYEQICYIGDDFPDLPCIKAVGLGVTVPEVSEEILNAALNIMRYQMLMLQTAISERV